MAFENLPSEYDVFSEVYSILGCKDCSVCIQCGGCTCSANCASCIWRAQCVCQAGQPIGSCHHSPFYVLTVHIEDCNICGQRCPVPCARSMPCTLTNRHLCWGCNPSLPQRYVPADVRMMSMHPPGSSSNASMFNPLLNLSEPLIRNDGVNTYYMSQADYQLHCEDLNLRRISFHLQHEHYRQMKQIRLAHRDVTQRLHYVSAAEEYRFVDFIQVLLSQPRVIVPTITVTSPDTEPEPEHDEIPASHPKSCQQQQMVQATIHEEPESNMSMTVENPLPSTSSGIGAATGGISTAVFGNCSNFEEHSGPIRRITSIRSTRLTQGSSFTSRTNDQEKDNAPTRTVRFLENDFATNVANQEHNYSLQPNNDSNLIALLASMNGVANLSEMIEEGLMGSSNCFGEDFTPIGGHLHPHVKACACDVCIRVAIWMDAAHRSMHSDVRPS